MNRGNDPDGYRWADVEREHRISRNMAANGNFAGARLHERHAAHLHRDHEVQEAMCRAMLGDDRGATAHMNAAVRDQRYENRLRSPPVYQYHSEADECGCVIL